MTARDRIRAAIDHRFGVAADVPELDRGGETLAALLERSSQREYRDEPVDPDLLRVLAAAALAAPSKSDLQQADILDVRDPRLRAAIADLIPGMPWVREAPTFLVFLANHRRQRALADLRAKPFPNDHLDAFFNATVDAAVVLATFVCAAEAVGLGCCPISVIRDHAEHVSGLLRLPERVIPVAGLCVGWPVSEGQMKLRLPLELTTHVNHFDDRQLDAQIEAYDRRRVAVEPYPRQRDVERFGESLGYGWSEDKARQYARAQRRDFGAFVRGKGFRLD